MEVPFGYTLITEPEVEFFKFSDFNQITSEVTKRLSSIDKRMWPWITLKMERRPPQARPKMMWYPGDRRTIVKLVEPRISIQHDVVMDKELLILNTEDLTSDQIKELNTFVTKIKYDQSNNV